MSNILIYSIGFLSQLLFSARTLIQWLMSEKQHRVVSPSLFWILSLIGSVLLFCYGWLRNDLSIMLGQSLTYYIYIWNLKSKGVWQHVFLPARWITLLLPPTSITCLLVYNTDIYARLFGNTDIPLCLLIYGSAGQVLFTCRFIYQWWYSHKLKKSVLPLGFWLISLVGCLIIISYGVFRLDPVIIIGQAFGLVVYSRNIIIWKKEKTSSKNQPLQ